MKNFTRILFFIFFIAFQNLAFSQNTNIKGIVLDSLETPMTGASVMLMHRQDSLLESFAIVGSKGEFEISAKTPDDYILQITFVGYGMFVRHLTVGEKDKLIDLGSVILNPDAVLLEGATVTADFIPILFKGDTVEYHADAFKTREGAVVEDLLRKLPGVEVDKEGKITAHGEEVKNVLIDGKQFFEDDPKTASKNIPADIVDKVQVFDKASDFSAFTGIDDGNGEKTINLAIKEGKNKGTFGNLKGGAGTEKRYAVGGNINRFNSKMQLSAIGSANNINEQPFSMRDYFDFMGGMSEMMRGGQVDVSSMPLNLLNNSGITGVFSGGLNLNYDFNKNTSIRSNYFTSSSNNLTDSKVDFVNVSENGSFSNLTESIENSSLKNHRARLNLHHKFSAKEDFKINFIGAMNNSMILKKSNSRSLSDDSFLINEADAETSNDGADYSWQTEAIYRKKLKKQGRFFTAEASLGNRKVENEYFIKNQTRFLVGVPKDRTEILDQFQEEAVKSMTYRAKMNYVEPILKFQYLNFSLERSNDLTDRGKDFSDRNLNGAYDQNIELSNAFERSFSKNTAGIGYRFIKEKIRVSAGADYQLIGLENDDFKNNLLQKSFGNLLPNAGLNYQITKNKRLMSRYWTRIQVPSVEELQPVLQNNDPLNIRTGNPDLEAAYSHNIDIRYSYFNMFYFRSFFIGGNLEFIDNAIINQVEIDESLVQTIQPINNGNELSLAGYFDFKTPIVDVDLKTGTGGNGTYSKSNILINNVLDRTENLNWNQKIEFENKDKDHFDVIAGYRIGINRTTFEINSEQNRTYLNHDLFGNFVWYLPKGWEFEIDYERQFFDENDIFSQTSFDFLNVSVSKSLLKNRFNISLEGNNLFDENLNVDRNSFGNQYFEKTSNTLGRLFLMRITYKIRSFGK